MEFPTEAAVCDRAGPFAVLILRSRLNRIKQKRDEKDMEEEKRSRCAGFIVFGDGGSIGSP